MKRKREANSVLERMMQRRNWMAMSTLALLVAAGAVTAQLEITRSTIDGGGGLRSTGGALELSGTIGQPDAGSLIGGDFELTGGFWFPLTPIDCNEDGIVNLVDHKALVACLTGPGASAGPACHCFDVDANGRVDLRDFAAIQKSINAM
jgi:hypothetical protein